MHIRHVPKIIEREEENCYLLVNRRNGQKLVLNESSFYVWKLCDGSTVEEIVRKVVEEFGIDKEMAEEQITNIIESLYQKGFVEKEE